MKKIGFFLLTFLLLIATGCTQENLVNREFKHTVISAVVEEPSDTRSHATDEGKFTWSKGDKISVYTSSGNFRTFALQGEGGTATSNFTGTLIGEENITQYAVYPNNGNHKVNGNTLTFNLPAEYGDFTTEYVANTHAAMIALMGNSNEFNFKHIGGVLRFKLDNVPIGSAQFVFTATDKDITGNFDVDLSTATPTIAAREKTTANSITIKFKPLESVQNDMTFFVPLPVGTYNGFTIAMKKQDGTQLVDYENETSNTLKHKSLAKFPKLKFANVSGSLEEEGQEAGTLVNGVAKLKEAGTLAKVLGNQKLGLTSLKVVGEINGTDVNCLRQMARAVESLDFTISPSASSYNVTGCLTKLDLSEARIVEGGDSYFTFTTSEKTSNYFTENDMLSDYFFYSASNLRDIKLPDNITEIGSSAFQDTSLSSVSIPNSVTTIEFGAFQECTYLTSVTIGNSVATIGERAFYHCTYLTGVNIPNSVITIGEYAFSSCASLGSVTIGNNVTTIGDYAFDLCTSLTSVTIPDGVKTIGKYAFMNCSSLTSVTIGNNVTTIGNSAFRYCETLSSVNIGNSVETIENHAFNGCSLTSVTIPKSVTSIGSSVFYNCSFLSEITCLATDPPTLEGVYVDRLINTLKVPQGTKAVYEASAWGKCFTNIVELSE